MELKKAMLFSEWAKSKKKKMFGDEMMKDKGDKDMDMDVDVEKKSPCDKEDSDDDMDMDVKEKPSFMKKKQKKNCKNCDK